MTWWGLGHTAGGPPVNVIECVFHKQQYIWFRAGDLSNF